MISESKILFKNAHKFLATSHDQKLKTHDPSQTDTVISA